MDLESREQQGQCEMVLLMGKAHGLFEAKKVWWKDWLKLGCSKQSKSKKACLNTSD